MLSSVELLASLEELTLSLEEIVLSSTSTTSGCPVTCLNKLSTLSPMSSVAFEQEDKTATITANNKTLNNIYYSFFILNNVTS